MERIYARKEGEDREREDQASHVDCFLLGMAFVTSIGVLRDKLSPRPGSCCHFISSSLLCIPGQMCLHTSVYQYVIQHDFTRQALDACASLFLFRSIHTKISQEELLTRKTSSLHSVCAMRISAFIKCTYTTDSRESPQDSLG